MFKYILILIVLYIIVTMEFHCFTSFDTSCLNSIQDKLLDGLRGFLDFILLIVGQIKGLL